MDSEKSNKKYIKFQNALWEYLPEEDANALVFWGPLCIRSKCRGQMEQIETGYYQCMFCDYSFTTDLDFSRLDQLVRQKIIALPRLGIKTIIDLDKLPAVNEKLEEENKFYKITTEHGKTGELKDIHILIGRKDNGGKKAHIIISPDSEIRIDKKDLHPSEEIKSITSIMYK